MVSASRQEQEFERRLAGHQDELRWLYLELFHGDTQAYDYFVGMLRRAWEERSEDLRRLDRQREQEPEWYKSRDLTGMLLYVNAFAGTIRRSCA